MSSETLSLQNARIVLNSLKTDIPLYLGSRFTVETDPNKREEFHKLISDLDPRDPDFKKTMLALKLIAIKQDPSSLSCFENIHAAISPVLPISKIPEPKMLQNDLSTILLALELAVSLFNTICTDQMKNALIEEQNLSDSLIVIDNLDCCEIPSTESLESFALFLRWAHFSRESTERSVFKLNNSSQNNISELIQLKQYSIDPEIKKLASFIYFGIQMNKLNKMDLQENANMKSYSIKAEHIATQYLKKYNPSLVDKSVFLNSPNGELLENFYKFLSDETIFADYKTKYNRLKALRAKSSKKLEFTATYFHLAFSPAFHTSNKFPCPEELGKWVFGNLLFDPVAKIADKQFIQFIQKTSGIDCYSFIPALEESPAPLPTLPTTSSSSAAIQSPSVASPIPEDFTPSKVVDACFIHSIFTRQTVQKHFPYHERVLAWFEDPSIPLSADKYRSLNPALQEEITWKHRFPRLVDSFVGTEYCLEGQWQKKNTLYFIPAEIERGGRTFRGGFQYAFLPDGTCYHRCWGEKSNDELIDQLMNQTIWNEIDFPPLEDALKPASKPKPEMIDSCPVELNPRSGMATFRDENTKITLFKIGLED